MSNTTHVQLQADGVLWMLNTTVFHPRGLALSRTPDGSLFLEGDGDEVWVFEESVAEEKKAAFDALIARHLEKQ